VGFETFCVQRSLIACNVRSGWYLRGFRLTRRGALADSQCLQMERRTLPASHSLAPVPPTLLPQHRVVPEGELFGLRERYPNVLIVGQHEVTAAAVSEIFPLLRLPITSIRVDRRVVLPLTQTHGTLILRDVDALTRREQVRLHKWLARTSGSTQVIGTSATAVFPLVERGTFLDVLYYRLNMTYLELC
jgi:Sigma-54 interaction domain